MKTKTNVKAGLLNAGFAADVALAANVNILGLVQVGLAAKVSAAGAVAL